MAKQMMPTTPPGSTAQGGITGQHNLHREHCTLQTANCKLQTTQGSMRRPIPTLTRTLHTSHWMLNIIQCALHTSFAQCTLHLRTAQFISTLYAAHYICKQQSEHCTLTVVIQPVYDSLKAVSLQDLPSQVSLSTHNVLAHGQVLGTQSCAGG